MNLAITQMTTVTATTTAAIVSPRIKGCRNAIIFFLTELRALLIGPSIAWYMALVIKLRPFESNDFTN